MCRIQLCDVIGGGASERSKCRFLHHRGHKLYISDLGLDRVYVLDLESAHAHTFGSSGRGGGQFSDPAGVAVDRRGWMLVSDAANDRLQVKSEITRLALVIFFFRKKNNYFPI